ncbi:pro-opiomelanocortin [Sorex fumeus]|uniref:pro-opiomelanocortin n=1 Tax=Sorex fumeus TaxID=62283 RepID=UPI0024AE4095|nr:pro-opiomelanocortin [Sorex fumeus]
MPRPCRGHPGALLLVLLLHASVEVRGWCLESGRCQDLTTESDLLACLRACQADLDLTAETPVFPGNGDEQPLAEDARKYVMGHFRWERFGHRNGSGGGVGSARREEPPAAGGDEDAAAAAWGAPRPGKRSYSMEHFRWGKPVGKKRRPVKVYPSGGADDDDSAEAFPGEFRRDLLEAAAAAAPEPARDGPDGPDDGPEPGLLAQLAQLAAAKKDGTPYRMEHFRWGSPPKDKRYGGFMTSEKSQTPLVTLFRNAIIKNAHKKGQ